MAKLNFESEQDFFILFEQLKALFPNASLFLADTTTQAIHYKFNTDDISVENMAALTQDHHNQYLEINTPKMRKRFIYQENDIYIAEHRIIGKLHILQPVSIENDIADQVELTEQLQDLAKVFNSCSPEMTRMFSIIQRVAITEFPVLVRGESGSGKELVAKAIHDYSQRKNKIFVAINCAALNSNILESELFGHVKGAFTGAIRDHKGVFERAASGTLFLDEIAEIPLELQAKLLRVLETGEFTPVGGEKPIQANVRIITATHKALREEAKAGRFRHDLLYRLRVIPIFIPPLRERKVDIPLIVDQILKESSTQLDTMPRHVNQKAMQILLNYDWPGNVRELKNTLLYALTMANGKDEIEVEDLPNELLNAEDYVKLPETNTELSPENVQAALEKYNHNLNMVANIFGISRTTLWRYRQKHKL